MARNISDICAGLKRHLVEGVYPDEFVIFDLDSPHEAQEVEAHLAVFIAENGMPYNTDYNGLQVFVYSSDFGRMSLEDLAKTIQQDEAYPGHDRLAGTSPYEPMPLKL